MRFFITIAFFFICLSTLIAQEEDYRFAETFDRTPLAEVLNLLKNKYDLKIAYDDALITGTTISGTFQAQSIPLFLSALLKDKGIDFQLLNGKIILIPKRVDMQVRTPQLFDLTVYGLVQDAMTGENLPNALVRVSGSNMGVTTNQDGYFSLPKVPNDTVTIEVSYVGYQKSETKLVPGQSAQTLRFSMQQSSIELSEFTVVDDFNSTINYGEDISQISINPKNLFAVPNLGELDIFRSLQLLPGIGSSNETSSSLAIRNSPSSQNLVLLDGYNLYRLDHFFGVFSAINADAIRDIQIYKGGYGAQYGGRVSGVVDMTGNTGNFNEPEFSIGANLLSARISANVPIASGTGALHFSYRRAYTDIIRSKLFENLYSKFRNRSNQVSQPNASQNSEDFLRPDFKFRDFHIKGSLQVSSEDILSISFYNSRDQLATDFDIVDAEPNAPTNIQTIDSFNEMSEWGNQGLGIIWSKNWNRNYFTSLQIARSAYDLNYNFENVLRNQSGDITNEFRLERENAVIDYQINIKNELSLGNRHQIKFGLNYSNLAVSNRLQIDGTAQGLTDLGSIPSAQGNLMGLYVSDKIYLANKLKLTVGLRHTFNDLVDESLFAPRSALSYQLSPTLEFKASAGKYYQLIREEVFDDPFTDAQNVWKLSSNALPALEANHYIAGLQYRKNNLTIDFEFYRKDLTGLSESNISHRYDPLLQGKVAELTPIMGTGEIRGIDFLIQKKMGSYQGWLAYSRSKATNRFDLINGNNEIPAREDQRDELKLVHIFEWQKWNFSATWIYGTGRPFFEPEINFITNTQGDVIDFELINTRKSIVRLPNYHRLDVSAALKFEGEEMRGEVGLSLLNVYNRNNIQSRRLNRNALEKAVSDGNTLNRDDLYREIGLLDFTPSIFLNLRF